ncbi:outer membrane channel protein [Glaciimonas sp. PCH181]|nr:outer membrane channel protein [Glaciimonas sp. PCH181]
MSMPLAGQAQISVKNNLPTPTTTAANPATPKVALNAVNTPDSNAMPGTKTDPKTGAKTGMRNLPAPVCVGEFSQTANVNLPEGKSGLLNLPQLHLPAPAWLRTVGDTDVVQVEPMTSPTARSMFFLFGKKTGSTNLMFQTKEGRCAMVEVSVGVDTASVQAKLLQLMPEEKNIRIGAAADSLVISGSVADAMAVERVMAIASAYVRKPGAAAGAPGAGGGGGGERIVNMLSIATPQQVMLEVKVAEISKTMLDQLGANFSAAISRGSWATSLVTNFLSGSNGVLNVTKSNGNKGGIDAQNQNGLVKILAEPTIMAISGQEGSFLAGGKIFIPVPQGTNGVVTLQEEEFGVGLRFTPTVLDGGRINLKVAPEVSELSTTGARISAAGTGVTSILPLITTRRAATTVQLLDGQSFAIAGLIKNNVTQNVTAFPMLGEIPILGALFRSSSFQTDKTELVFIVTPRLVKPLPPDYALPTDQFVEPNRAEFFLGGKMEGSAPPARTVPAPTNGGPVSMSTPEVSSSVPSVQPNAPSGFEFK